MINITVKKRKGSYLDFLSKGHAGYAEEGQDIVCAAVSALIITTVNSLENLRKSRLKRKRMRDMYPSILKQIRILSAGNCLWIP